MVGIGGDYYYNRWKDIGYTQHLYGGNLCPAQAVLPGLRPRRIRAHQHRSLRALVAEAGSPVGDMLWVGGGYYQGVTDRIGCRITAL